MTKVKSTFGRLTGHVGNNLFNYSRKQNVLRSMPTHYTDLNSQLQKNQRAKWSTCQAFFKQFSQCAPLLWYPNKPGFTSRNSILRYNMANAMTGSDENWSMDLPKVKFFKGWESIQLNPSCVLVPGGYLVNFTWNTIQMLRTDPTDTLVLFACSTDGLYFNLFGVSASRSSGLYAYNWGPSVSSKMVYFWGAWISDKQLKWSDSFLFGLITFP